MLALLCSIFLVIAFAFLLKLFVITKDILAIVNIIKSVIKTLGSVTLTDTEKGRSIRVHVKRIFIVLSVLLLKSLGALFIPFSIIWLIEKGGCVKLDEIMNIAMSWPFISGTIILYGIAHYLLKKKGGKRDKNSVQETEKIHQYSESEKWLHNLAFHTLSFQISLSNFESLINKRKLDNIKIEKPIFITALPRSGTTLLLELFISLDGLATHTYRNMPFFLIPLFWNRVSKNFRNHGTVKERSHGDGMMISVDNPEAFEEIIWKCFWPSRYREKRIVPWPDSEYKTFNLFLKNHMKKVLLLHKNEASVKLRYISKNNLNIARINYLKKTFPDSICLIPFRNPFEHASSLLRQHKNFYKIHTNDSFSSKYMSDIGHFEFGRNLKPIDFQGWVSGKNRYDPFKLDYWLNYWIISYEYLLNTVLDDVKFISYESLCKDPVSSLNRLSVVLEIKDNQKLLNNALRILPPKSYEIDKKTLPVRLVEKANSLYRALETASII
ncbi:MAG: sulfotransferase [Chitinispirillia bacterium]|jgi:hypothetical protein